MSSPLHSLHRCELCGSKKNSDWKCCECAQIMCRRCKKLHIKANISKFHNFIALKSDLDDQHDKCPVHKTEVCHTECRTCGIFVCEVCVRQSHDGHDMIYVHQAIKELKERCRQNLADVKDLGLSMALKEMETFRQLADDYKTKTQTLLKEVTSRYQTWVAMTRNLQDDMLQQIQNLYKLDMSYYETECKLRENLILQMEEIIQKFHKSIKGESRGVKGLLKLREIDRSMKDMMTPSTIEQKVVPTLSSGNMDDELLKKLFGQLSFIKQDLAASGKSDCDEGLPVPPESNLTVENNKSAKSKTVSIPQPNHPNLLSPGNRKDFTRSQNDDQKSKARFNGEHVRHEGPKSPRKYLRSASEEETEDDETESVASCDTNCRVHVEFSNLNESVPNSKSFLQSSFEQFHNRKLQPSVSETSNAKRPTKSDKDSIFGNSKVKPKGNISIHDTFFSEPFREAPDMEKICHVYLQGRAKVCSVCPVGDKAWVGFSDKSVALINGRGNVLKRSKVGILPIHLSASFSGDVIICSENTPVVKSMSPTGSVKEVQKFSGDTGGIYVTRDGSTLVSLPSLGAIVRLSQSGGIHSEIKHDARGEPMFDSPYSLTENIEGNICVIDGKNNRLNEQRKYVVCVDDKTVIFRYKCDSRTDFQHISCDQYSNIILSDPINFNIKILNRAGSFIGVLGRDSFLLVDPRCVVFDEHFNLWVVNDKNRITVAKYILD